MKLRTFLKDKLFYILSVFAVGAFIALFIAVLHAPAYAAIFLLFLYAFAVALPLVLEYLQKRSFYTPLLKNLEELDKKYLMSELIDEPSFTEGRILYEALVQSNKSMNDEIARYRLASQEYREYIEAWVHEVKTPIASSRLIIENNQSAPTLSIEEELKKIEKFVEQALFYTRSNTVEKDYVIKRTTLKALVASALKKNAPMFIENNVSVSSDNLDKEVFTDLKWTDFILTQILTNSVKYKKDEAACIRMIGVQNENSVTLYLRDNGIGIPQRDLARVCEKGFTGSNGRTTEKSTGLGLYLCKKLCDKLNLGLAITSEEGKGTTVAVTFPRSNMFV